jgi:hypothetical protein
MGLDQCKEVLVVLLLGQLIRAAIKVLSDAPNRSSVNIARGISQVVELEGG